MKFFVVREVSELLMLCSDSVPTDSLHVKIEEPECDNQYRGKDGNCL